MIDTQQLLDKFMNSGMAGGLAGGLAGGALTGLLANKKGREIAGSALKVGGVALAGGLAYKAYQNYRSKQVHNPAEPASSVVTNESAVSQAAFMPPDDDVAARQSLGLLLLRAMISAAKADGSIDHNESGKILSEINRVGLEPEEKALLFDEYLRPIDIHALVNEVQTMEQAVDVYAASLLVVDSQNEQETRYLQDLGQALNLEHELIVEIERAVVADMAPNNINRNVA